jgi:competence ComEA-like helix-hairpin-helix protein
MLLLVASCSTLLGWWERRPPKWIREDPLRHPFAAEFLDPGLPEETQAEPESPPPKPTGPVWVNVATLDELCSLQGVGSVTAQRIVDSREQEGRFLEAKDLLRVRGIGPKTLEKMRTRLRFDSSSGRTPAP